MSGCCRELSLHEEIERLMLEPNDKDRIISKLKRMEEDRSNQLHSYQCHVKELEAQLVEKAKRSIIKVNVRWWDGYLETFEATEVRAGAYLLWMRLENGSERNIPLQQVRWFSKSEESHEK